MEAAAHTKRVKCLTNVLCFHVHLAARQLTASVENRHAHNVGYVINMVLDVSTSFNEYVMK